MNGNLELRTPDMGAEAQVSLGATLRALRHARRVELAEMSTRLKFSVRQLQALEEEDWARLPAGLPLRGMVKNYARYLQTDVAPLLTMLDLQTGSRADGGVTHVLTPMSLGNNGVPLYSAHTNRPWGWLLLILALVVLVGLYVIERGWVSVSDWLRALLS